MKKGYLILLCWMLLCSMASQASHILGGEITYVHVKDLKYKVQTVIYRDCNGCKLMGEGGGESTQDCGKFDLFLATSDASSCGRKNLVKLNLERKKIQELLPVCGSSLSKCRSNSSLPFGVEAHIFESEIDFNDYSAYKGCAFEIYTSISWRTKGISTIDDDQPFYNFAYINPWVRHHSPDFKSEISPVIYCKQPYYYSHAIQENLGDSISFHMVSAKSDYNKNVAYKSGYGPSNPLDVYCSGCTPDETTFPPNAFNFNARTGDIAFTPINCGQTGVIVLEARKWAKISGVMEVISIVRRDLQYIVLNSAENNPPQPLLKSTLFEVCAGEELKFDIAFEDKPFKYPDETYGPKDSLRIYWDQGISEASLTQHPFPDNGKYKATFTWKTSADDIRDAPYRITVYANDDACPLNAISSRTYEVKVIKPADVKLEMEVLECAYREMKASSNLLLKLKDWTITGLNPNSTPNEFLTETVLYKASSPGFYEVRYQAKDPFGCNVSNRDTFEIEAKDFDAFDLQLNGNNIICKGSEVELTSTILGNHQWKSNAWIFQNVGVSQKDTLRIEDVDVNMQGSWILVTEGALNGRLCSDTLKFDLEVNLPPKSDGIYYSDFCAFDGDLFSAFKVTPPGVWSTEDEFVSIVQNKADLSRLNRSVDYIVQFILTLTDTTTQCTSEEEFSLTLKAMPELEMEDVAYCKNSGNFYIDNLIVKPTSKHLLNLTWILDETRLNLSLDPTNQRWFVPSSLVENGTYKIIFTQTSSNGCFVTDSADLIVMDELKIKMDGIDSICGGSEIDLSPLLNVFPAGGGWYCSENTEFVKDNRLMSDACGPMELSYTYDKFGCFDRAYLRLFVDCPKPIKFVNSFSQICSNYPPVQLEATPSGGNWSGTGIQNNQFNPTGLKGDYPISYHFNGLICQSEETFLIHVSDAPLLISSELTSSICEGQSWDLQNLKLSAEEINYMAEGILSKSTHDSWISYKPSSTEIANGKAIIQVSLKNSGLCSPLEETLSSKISQKPSVTFPDELKGCEPAKLRIQADYIGRNDPVVQWKWAIQDESFVQISNVFNPFYTYAYPGIYDLSLDVVTSDKCNYSYEFPKQVIIHPSPDAVIESDPENFASSINPVFNFKNLSTGGAKLTYLWNFGTGKSNQYSTRQNPTFTFPHDTGKYWVNCAVTNEYGCTAEASKWIEIGPDIKVFIPNAFTPDGKGPEQNSKYRITTSAISSFHITIINRVGGIVYESDNPAEGWDGTAFGNACMPGVYVYDISLVSLTGKKYKYSGTLNLIR